MSLGIVSGLRPEQLPDVPDLGRPNNSEHGPPHGQRGGNHSAGAWSPILAISLQPKQKETPAFSLARLSLFPTSDLREGAEQDTIKPGQKDPNTNSVPGLPGFSFQILDQCIQQSGWHTHINAAAIGGPPGPSWWPAAGCQVATPLEIAPALNVSAKPTPAPGPPP